MAQQPRQQDNNAGADRKQVALVPIDRLAPMRLPVTQGMLDRLGLTEPDYRVLTDQIFPGARTVEAISMALAYCKHRNLDIMKRPVHIVPMWSSALRKMVETVWPGIAEIRTTASRTGQYAGDEDAEYGPTVKAKFIQVTEDEYRQQKEIERVVEHPEWCRSVVYKLLGGQRYAFHARVFWREAYATAARGSEMPNEMWRKRPWGQLEKCAEAAALRKAFPEELGNEMAAEEMEGRTLNDDTVAYVEIPTTPSRPARPPKPAAAAASKPGTSPSGQAREDAAAKPQAADEPSQRPADGATIVDADFDVMDDEADASLAADTDFFEELRDRMGEATDAATVEEIWLHYEPLTRFANDPVSQDICQKIRAMRLKMIAAQ